MNLSEKEQQILDRKPSIMKFVAKQLLRGINSILNDECDENELANTISHMDKLGTAFVDPDEYWNYDRCMDELGMGQNRAAFTALMKKHGIKNRKVNNVHVGFPKADIIALDILKKGNRVYCPEYCCFVPAFINSLFTKSNKIRGKYPVGVDFHCGKFRARVKKVINGKRGRLDLGYFNSPEEAFDAYKIEREKYFKETADKYKDVIPEKVYNAIVNYKVEYDD